MSRTGHSVEQTDAECGMSMCRVSRRMSMEMLVGLFIVIVGMLVNFDPPRLDDRPDTDSDEHEPNREFGPSRCCIDVDDVPKGEAKPANDQHSEPMSKTPFRAGERRPGWIFDGNWSEGGQMVNANKHMEKTGGEAGDDDDQVNWFSPGTGVRINHTEFAMPRARVIAK